MTLSLALISIDYYTRAAQRAVLDVAISAVSPMGIAVVVGTVGFAAIGVWGANKRRAELMEMQRKRADEEIEDERKFDAELAEIEIKYEYQEGYVEANSLVHVEEYRVVPRIENTSEVIEKALDKFLEKTKKFERLKHGHHGPRGKARSEEELRVYWKEEISKGTCAGQASTLLDVELKEGETFSLQNRLGAMEVGEAIFRQCINELKVNSTAWIESRLQSHYELKKLRYHLECASYEVALTNHKLALMDGRSVEGSPPKQPKERIKLSRAEYIESKLKKNREEEARLNAWEPLAFVDTSKENTFSADLSRVFYQSNLEKAVESSPIKNGQIRGMIRLPKHVMTFQYGPKEYFIYDPYSAAYGGLFKYPDEETFFRGMRTLVRQFMSSEKIKSEEALVSFRIYEGRSDNSNLLQPHAGSVLQ